MRRKSLVWLSVVIVLLVSIGMIDVGISQSYPCLWIHKNGGKLWLEWKEGIIGEIQTVYARIVNTGDLGCYVKVCLIIRDAGEPVLLWSDAWWIEPDGPAGPHTRVTVSRSFAPEVPGIYTVRGVLWFSLDGFTWTPWHVVQDSMGGEGISLTRRLIVSA